MNVTNSDSSNNHSDDGTDDKTLSPVSREAMHGGLMRTATYASVTVASILIVAKLGGWLATGSVSILSSLVDSILDAGASIINLLAVRHAFQPADREHRFGHGKAESLAGLAQAAFIAGSGVFLLLEAIDRFVNPQPITNTGLGMSIMMVSIALTIVLVGFQLYVIRKTKSVAINADSLHYRADLLVNIAVIVSLILASKFQWYIVDPMFALAIVAYMTYGAFDIARQSLDVLMDKELPAEERARIKEIAMSHPKVFDVHDMRTRSAGSNLFIQLHIDMPREITLIEAHDIAEDVMALVEGAYPEAEVLVHQDPEGVDERRDEVQD